jgi:beta-barrel assembly-enhancing protease
LIERLASDGWTGELLYARAELYRSRGKVGDFQKAIEFYRQSIASGADIPENWRGLGVALLRSGAKADGQQALKDYLMKRPDATDKAMVAMMAGGI